MVGAASVYDSSSDDNDEGSGAKRSASRPKAVVSPFFASAPRTSAPAQRTLHGWLRTSSNPSLTASNTPLIVKQPTTIVDVNDSSSNKDRANVSDDVVVLSSPPTQRPPPIVANEMSSKNVSTKHVAQSPIEHKPTRKRAKIDFSDDSDSDNDRNASPIHLIHDDDDDTEVQVLDDDDTTQQRPNRFLDASFVPQTMEESMLAFFNTAAAQEIIDVVGCTDEIAAIVLKLRPFTDTDHMDTSFTSHKKKKALLGLAAKYEEQMEGYLEVDNLVAQCEKYGDDVMAILKRWTRKNHALGGYNITTDENDDEKEFPEVSLVAVDDSAEEDDADDPNAGYSSVLGAKKNNGTKCLKRQPAIVNPKFTLKSYQLVGVSWLNMLHSKGFGGILADQMGLGKTAQVISFLGYLKMKGNNGPHLIIVPSSTLENWMRECAKWCPSLRVQSYYGSQTERADLQDELLDNRDSVDVLISTYTLATSNKTDRSFIRKFQFHSMILDEGHMIKNMNSARYKHLMSFDTPFRLLLTGTPLQNSLMELLALLTFIMPDLFAENSESFSRIFKIKNAQKKNVLSASRIERASRIMAPFILRRRKDQVHTEMPKKHVNVVRCSATESQNKLRDEILNNTSSDLLGSRSSSMESLAQSKPDSESSSFVQDSRLISNIMMQLRKVADHPLLFRRIYTDDVLRNISRDIMNELEYVDANQEYIFEDLQVMSDFDINELCGRFKYIKKYAITDDNVFLDSGKVKWLMETLPQMIKNGDRILIFSQFVIMLNILEKVMSLMNVTYVRLDGSTAVSERQGYIDSFNDSDDIPVFLLSTKAGGFGINLTAANVVVIYDLDFNPHNDAQAEDRAHRVGQTRDVTVMKLILDGTIEERIYEVAEMKLKLDQRVQHHAASGMLRSGSLDTKENKTKKKNGKNGGDGSEQEISDDEDDDAAIMSSQIGGEIASYLRKQLRANAR